MMATWRGAVLILAAAAMAPGCVLLHPTDPYRSPAPSALGDPGAVRPEWDSLPEGPLTLAEATVKEAEAKWAIAKARLSECVIRAPFPATIAQVHVRPGDLATPGA